MTGKQIQWFPGHMAKTRRMMQECLSDVDVVFELADARIPHSSRNPEIRRIVGDKPSLTLYNKASLADPTVAEVWISFLRERGEAAIFTDCLTGEGMNRIIPAVRTILADKLERYREKGMSGRRLKAMVVGIPNVGKSTLINRLAGAKKAKAENRPGVTQTKQWIPTSLGIDLLDMPGVLWPRFDEKVVGENLAITGAIKDEILETEAIAALLCERLRDRYPQQLCERYKLDPSVLMLSPEEILTAVGKRRGILLPGGIVDTERTADMLLHEFRNGKTGRITLELPLKENDYADV